MKLATFSESNGHSRLGAVSGDRIVDLALADMSRASGSRSSELPTGCFADMIAFLTAGNPALARARQLLEIFASAGAPADPVKDLATVTLRSPVERPEKIVGVGLNYRDHCREIGRDIPADIRTFGMFANSLVGNSAPVILPTSSQEMDWEAELVVVIGKPGKYIPVADALGHVAGYTIGNDVSARDHQRADPQAMRAKSGDTHSPIGPWLVTADEIPDPAGLEIALSVNGVEKQRSNTAEMVFSVAEIVAFLSRYFTLKPGDLIFTGTPAGVGMGRKPPEWLRPGDRMDVSIERIGTLSNPCIGEAPASQ
jgi:acylpyruvate hydrolase